MKNLLFILLISFNITYGQFWSQMSGLPNQARYDDIFFINQNIGWSVSSNGKIFKTIDAGENWNLVFQGSMYFRTIEFIDQNIGIAASLDGSILRTIDGGINWIDIQNQIPVSIPGICGLSHINNNFYGVGIWSNPAYFIKSTDQGLTWSYKDMSSYADGLVECHFITEDIGYVSGIIESNGGVLLKTTDGGNTWTELFNTNGGSEYIWKLDFVNEQVAYGSIQSYFNGTNIIKSIDGGNTWTNINVTSDILDLEGIGFVNENKGWIAPKSSPMLETNDGGLTWVTLNDYPNINKYFRINEGLMFASGSNLYKYSDETVSTNDENNIIEEHDLNVQNNPFKENLKIKINIDATTFSRLELFELNGKLVLPAHIGKLTKGSYIYNIDTKNIKSGIYILLLRTNHGFLAKKVIKN